MRVTDSHATQQAISSFATARARLDASLQQVSSGHRFTAASEDPTAALGVMQNSAQSRAIEQYRRNIGVGRARTSLEEGALDELSSLLTRAKELAVSQGSDTANPDTRRASAAEANQLLAQAVQLASTKHGGEYLFGGDAATTAPFALDMTGPVYAFTVATPAPNGSRALEISAGQRLTPTHDGTQVFGDATTGVLSTLRDLATALQSGDRAAIAGTLPAIDATQQSTQTLVGEVGARAQQLDAVDAQHAARAIQLTADSSDLRDVDAEAAMTDLVGRQTALQAAMAATARIFGISLTDYLR